MCCKAFWKRILPFAVTLIIATGLTSILQERNFAGVRNSENQVFVKPSTVNHLNSFTYPGVGCSRHNSAFNDEESNKTEDSSIYKKLSILSKPKAVYTDLARQNKIQDVVILRVTFLANGELGAISSVSGLPDGLTEQAILAAKQIKFKPAATKDGRLITVTKLVRYNFKLE